MLFCCPNSKKFISKGGHSITIKKFNSPTVSSKIGICGLPLRVDTYSLCSFGCTYCFANNREIMKSSDFKVANLNHLRKTLERILDRHEIDENSLSDKLISEGVTWHCGGLCDPFMPCEEKYHITSQMIDICNKYGRLPPTPYLRRRQVVCNQRYQQLSSAVRVRRDRHIPAP